MWKVLFFLACLVGIDVVISTDHEKCGTNERYVACPDTMCIPRNCSQRGFPVACPILGPEGTCPGKPACICVENYLRDDTTGECIPSKKCKPPVTTTAAPTTETTYRPTCGCGEYPPKCGKYEVYNNCSDTGCRLKPYLCSELGFPLKCDKKCKPGCICKDGYLRDDKGYCVPIKSCPSCGGDPNAESGCGNNCGKTCATYQIKKPVCLLICRLNGCDCRDGYVYDPNVKSCVRPKDCTPTCKVNEQYSPCINGGCGPKNCSEVDKSNICVDPKTCIKGCVCVKGYLRHPNGTCVPIDQCPKNPPKCGKNEVYNNCSDTGCRLKPYHCSELGFPLKCDKKCKPGCICKDGYLRDDKGYCVPIKSCPSCGGDPNAESGCGNNCGKTCATYKIKKPVCLLKCRLNGCDCRDGYVYDPNVKSCVRPKDCTPTCKVNEQYSPCINGGCGPKNCSEVGKPNICVHPKTCIKGCVCVKGYLRHPNGTCVPIDQCPKNPPKCGKNEVYNNCSLPVCRPYLCSDLGFPCNKKCKPGCICKTDYLRDDKGYCIPIKNCPSCGGDPNAESGCGNNCGKTCATYKIKKPVCLLKCRLNGCDCRDGYVYDPNVKSCVRPKDCTPTCKVNEQYSPCINGGCGPKNCSEVGKPNICVHPKTCIKGCVCVKGYLRHPNGTCVPIGQCPKNPPKCGKNEVYNNCSLPVCRPYLCSDLGFPCNKKCEPGCICKANYLRDDKGYCIPIKNCPSCGGDPNAEPGCGNNCGKTCNKYKITPPPICALPCRLNGCNCKDGYLYDPNLKACVRPKDCTPTCKVNEQYSPCINGGCGPKNCSEVGKPNICIDPKTCIKGCVCVKGYLRHPNGTCVPIDQCPKNPPKCGKNEVYENCSLPICRPYCCSDLGFPCNTKCEPGCICKDGYLRDKNGDCIPIKNCPPNPPKCGINEVYENCSRPICRPYCCSDLGFPCNTKCEPGCICKDGYLRDKNGDCIPIKNCPPNPPKCGINEVYENCSRPICRPYCCSDLGFPCNTKCEPGCICKDGYLRDKNGDCIPIKNCPPNPPKCGINEVYENCSRPICRPYCCSDLGFPCNTKCEPGCICKDGYLRDKNGDCIPIKNCPQNPPKCGKNEVYENCSLPICRPYCCSDLGFPCNTKCEPGCICKDGYLRDKNGDCIPINNCPQNPPKCGKNEVYENCSLPICRPYCCSDLGFPCNTKCEPGCICKDGYLRDKNGDCIPIKNCPPPNCPTGEVWDTCPTVPCEGDNCAKTRDSPQTCPVGIVCDTPRCVCGYNRKRDKNGKCILITDCPPFKCDLNEEYQACSSNCPGEKCSDYTNKTKCPLYKVGILVNCRPACKCIKGYYRNDHGKCVPACECPDDYAVEKL